MKQFKFLPLSLSVAAVLGAAPALANSEIEELQQRLSALEEKAVTLDYFDDQQPAILPAELDVPLGVVFSGYARYGSAFETDDAKYVNSDGALNGNATGRLGNEGNGGEFQFAKIFENDEGAIWNVAVMLEHWGDDVGLKKFYAGVSNLFDAQPDLYLWAGRDFNQRPQIGLNDYFWMNHDGQGAGFYNLGLGGNVGFDLSVVAQADGNGSPGDNGRYAVTSKLHSINFGPADLSFFANYGFSSDSVEDNDTGDTANTAYQLATQLSMFGQNLVVRYSDNAKDSVFDLAKDQEAMLVSLDGTYSVTNQIGLEYQTAYQSLEGKDIDDRVNYNVIVRPTYAWNNTHSTWLEGGYNVVDFDDIDAKNTSWKTTISQNISFGDMGTARPMLRFYATYGNSDNEYTVRNDDGTLATRDEDTLTVGAMFEAWW
ncbi:carbohydrate porin [Vibrio superstes]|uniref:Outer membrane protein S n=1 Tax=Vibrio superstes NBRC 103154 TaxID=1219062 RepID=A0A511QQK0_9VIBR|nr:carbohydrate porin [Vibrio superstes]GEM79571.1 outer membrane protein S [Vibrio superstes NBRC 103154]